MRLEKAVISTDQVRELVGIGTMTNAGVPIEVSGPWFDEWLRSIKREAWDEGHRCAVGYVAVPELVPDGGYENPYA